MKDILFNPLLKLSNVNRYSGIYLAKPENTSDHTAQVGLYALLIGNEVNKKCREFNVTFRYYFENENDEPHLLQVDMGVLALKALVHDIDEASSADIPRTVKYSSEKMRDLFHELEDKSVKQVADQFDFQQLYRLWQNSKDKSVEGYIIKVADLLTVVHKTVEEVNILGNKNMLKVAVEVLEQVKQENTKLTLDKVYDDVVKLVFTEIYVTAINVLQEIVNDNQSEISDYYFKSN